MTAATTITIYHLSTSRSERIIWLMEELGLPYELERTEREPTAFAAVAPSEYKRIHPVGKSPIIRDADLVLIESGAIVEYLVTKYGNGKLVPKKESPDYARYVQWLHFAEGGAMHQFVLQHTLNRILAGSEVLSPMTPWVSETTERYRSYIEDELGTRPYISGSEFTAADIMMPLTVSFMLRFEPVDRSRYPNSKAYLERIAARLAYKKAMAIANP